MSTKNLFKSSLILLVIVASTSVFAQQQMPKRTPEERAQRQTMWMQNNLGITNEQSKKVHDIILAGFTAAADGSKKNEMPQIKTNLENQLKAVLTADQYQKYMQHVEEMKNKMQQRGMQAAGGY